MKNLCFIFTYLLYFMAAADQTSPAALAAVSSTAVLVLAAMAVLMVVMVVVAAVGIRVILQSSCQQSCCRVVSLTSDTIVEFDSDLGQRGLSSSSDPTADQRVHPKVGQKSRQRAMTAACGIHYLSAADLPILRIVDLELLAVPEVLEDRTGLSGDCTSHYKTPRSFIWVTCCA